MGIAHPQDALRLAYAYAQAIDDRDLESRATLALLLAVNPTYAQRDPVLTRPVSP